MVIFSIGDSMNLVIILAPMPSWLGRSVVMVMQMDNGVPFRAFTDELQPRLAAIDQGGAQ